MIKISDVYEQYKIMPNLRDHMLRVSAVAMQVADSLDVPIRKEMIIKACLLHDMGNIIKFDLEHFPEFLEPAGLEYWQRIQSDFTRKHGNDEHEANMQIARELGADSHVLACIDSIGFGYWCRAKEDGTLEEKICAYADTRVAPHGVVSIADRLEDGYNRYKDKNTGLDDQRITLGDCMYDMEKEIFSMSKIKPQDIHDASIKSYLELLKDHLI